MILLLLLLLYNDRLSRTIILLYILLLLLFKRCSDTIIVTYQKQTTARAHTHSRISNYIENIYVRAQHKRIILLYYYYILLVSVLVRSIQQRRTPFGRSDNTYNIII
jgi:hypothetical protein